MKIKMITLYAGPAGVMSPGGIYDVDAALGNSLVAGHYAKAIPEPVAPVPAPVPVVEPEEEHPVETGALTAQSLEQAVKPRRRKS